MIQKNILGVVFFLVSALASNAYAGKMELTTYYPAPTGEYGRLQAKGSCVGKECDSTDVTNDNLKIKKNAASTGGNLTVENTATIETANITGTTTSTNLTVTGTTTVSSTGGFVIQKRTGAPTNPVDGQIWIQS